MKKPIRVAGFNQDSNKTPPECKLQALLNNSELQRHFHSEGECNHYVFQLVNIMLFLYFFLTEHHSIEVYWVSGEWLHAFLTSALDGGGWSIDENTLI
jgi:hypothetical protein